MLLNTVEIKDMQIFPLFLLAIHFKHEKKHTKKTMTIQIPQTEGSDCLSMYILYSRGKQQGPST